MEQMATGTVVVTDTVTHKHAETDLSVAIYARVSSSDQKNDLEAQLGRLAAYANEQGWSVIHSVAEIGSGLNGHRPKLMKLLADPDISAIVVEHRDRLMRFGVEYVESALAAHGRKLFVVDASEVKDDLVQDMIEVLTSFCARMYGRRSARNKAKKALRAIEANGDNNG
jgi:predicted site-specific integrase-resolvase